MDYYDYPMEEEVAVHAGFQFQPWQWQWRLLAILSSPALSSPAAAAAAMQPRLQHNHVRWEETAAAHLFSANLPGVRKEEIRVEVEDATYLVIRTELLEEADADAAADDARRTFTRKFRLPGMVDTDGISADYAHGVLTVTVPRMHTRLRPAAGGPASDSAAPAA